MAQEEDKHSLEAKFVAAVKVIRSLPEEGPFQPSDDMMLLFYSYYKQATLGPCNIPRPNGFWDTRGKAKWDSWSALGNMTKEEAMKNYVEDIQLILEAIPVSEDVSNLVQKLGNFYTEVDVEGEEGEEMERSKRPFTRPFANHADELVKQVNKPTMEGESLVFTVAVELIALFTLCNIYCDKECFPHRSGYGDLWDDIQNFQENDSSGHGISVSSEEAEGSKENSEIERKDESSDWVKSEQEDNEDEEDNTDNEDEADEEEEEKVWRPDPKLLMVEKRWRSDTGGSSSSSMEPSMSSFTNGTHSSLNSEAEEEELACSIEPSEQYNSYMLFKGHLRVMLFLRRTTDPQTQIMRNSGLSTSNVLSPGSGAVSGKQSDRSNTTLNGGDDQVVLGESYLKEEISASQHNSSLSRRGRGLQSPRAACSSQLCACVDAACYCVSQSRHPVSVARGNVNEQIATALLRLQHDMTSVLHRLHALEALTVSQVKDQSQDYLRRGRRTLYPQHKRSVNCTLASDSPLACPALLTTEKKVTLPLSHLINVLHSMKSSVGSSSATFKSRKHKENASDSELHRTEPMWNMRELGLSDLGAQQLDELVNSVLPRLSPQEAPLPLGGQTAWHTSHLSTHSFFFNKHGFSCGAMPMSYSRQQPSPLQSVCTELQYWPDSLRRTRLILLVLLLVGLYGISKTPFISVRFRTTSGLDSAVDPVQMKNVTFEHVKGIEEAKNELQEVVEFLKNPKKFTVLGGKLPKGVLLVGPPGTGKTLLARAVAGEADVPFYYASGSEFDEMFVGVGASRIRNLFKEAKANAPCVIFIDELDSVGGKRIESPMHPYSRQTINQLLAEMDGFKPNEGVIIIGATNFPEALDNALIRPGRFDMQVTVPKPDVKGRTEILNWYLKKIKMDPAIEANIIARGTVGFSGADLENLVNQAALKAAVDGKDMVTLKELEFAKDKILMGPERRSAEIDEKNKIITAYHESGHAIVAYYTKDAMPINKATIMPRGPSLGHVSMLPENDRWSETRSQLLAQMDVSMGGRVAEEIIFGHEYITTGASSDFDSATKIAKMMVTRFGMCEKLGVMTYTDMTAQSPETQAAVEHEVRVLLKDSYERAKVLLKTHSKEHKNLADALLMYETLDAKEIKLVLEGKALEAS
ncbi:hypothetical protein FQN60_016284 [Etheostoma spectabile]|uniref:ATP-dependent zinc metalloprotease YME1L1 n=1 Tax=Etheostoma spectabile TaxID=54343 RepID=A0A5J5CYL2_9PERO|nr:hypothetical protein FQN60_016284 [Etheostoma spectabile]